MPSRKQKRRRAKEHRHEYVWEDAEGNELEPDEVPTKKPESGRQSRPLRTGREPQAPSWNKTLRRGAIFAPIMFVVVYLLSSDLSLASQLDPDRDHRRDLHPLQLLPGHRVLALLSQAPGTQ